MSGTPSQIQIRKDLRSKIKALRENLSTLECEILSEKIKNNLINIHAFQKSIKIALYSSFQGEVDTKPIIEYAWEHGKICYLPLLRQDKNNNKFLTFARFNKNDALITNKYGILEPKIITEELLGKDMDLVIVPLVAFDSSCNRLGYGGGYYDRTFAFKKTLPKNTKPLLIGIAYELQKVDQLDNAEWDVPLDYVVTEKSFFERFWR